MKKNKNVCQMELFEIEKYTQNKIKGRKLGKCEVDARVFVVDSKEIEGLKKGKDLKCFPG
jgi:hypothetical protein